MKLDLSELIKSAGAVIPFHLEEEIEVEGVELLSPVIADCKFSNTHRSIVIECEFDTSYMAECVRCLKHFPYHLHFAFQEAYTRQDLMLDSKGNLLTEDEDIRSVFEGYVLDLSELLRQNIIIALPVAPLCSPDCKGLCPKCGKDLNEGECDCEKKKIDPRWQKLSEYKSKGGMKVG
ncbi:MAG: YceD family protein [bacterium]